MAEKTDPSSPLAIILQLEAMARAAESEIALRFLALNETRRLVPYRQASYFSGNGTSATPMRLRAVSSVTILDRNAPYVSWVESMIATQPQQTITHISYFDRAHCPEKFRAGWDEYSMPYVLWCPLVLPNRVMIGALWLGRDTPWLESEQVLVKRLSDTYAHSMGALLGGKARPQRFRRRRTLITAALVALVILALPVRMSALAPAELVARDPVMVSAPMDGVIARIHKPPSSEVKAGDLLLEFDDTKLRNSSLIAERGLQVAEAELRGAVQGAFLDNESKAKIALLRTQVGQHRAKLDYARELLGQVEVKAQRDGLLLYGSKNDWIGKPVQTGERIMQVADPRQIEIELLLPVADSIVLVPGSEVKVFLDKDPLRAVNAVLTHASYNAEVTDDQVLAYRLTAELTDPEQKIRIGLQGTAKVYGERVSLFFYLFRRPISTLRQFFGF